MVLEVLEVFLEVYIKFYKGLFMYLCLLLLLLLLRRKKREEKGRRMKRERGPRPPGIDRGHPYNEFPASFIQITPQEAEL